VGFSQNYSEWVDRLLGHGGEWLGKLRPTEPLTGYAGQLPLIRQATDVELSGGKPVAPLFAAIRAGLFYQYDALADAEETLRPLSGDLAAYWQAMVFRRAGEFELARNCGRSAGELPFFTKLHQTASVFSAIIARQYTWDPYLFTGLCEQHRFGDDSLSEELIKLQRAEFEEVFDYTWRHSAL